MQAALVRNSNDQLLYIMREDKTFFLADILQGNVLKIPAKEKITNLNNETEFNIQYRPTIDGTLTFLLSQPQRGIDPNTIPFGINSGAAGGGGGRTGVYVQEEGTQVNGIFKTLNFIGGTVTVTDAGAGVANISITAAIAGSGTLNFIPKWTPDGNSLGNSIAYDDGTNIGISTTSPASKFHVNGTIRTGLASTTNGSLIFNNSTNANTLTINSGVTSATHAWTLPLAQGAASSFLMNDGSGTLSWNTGTGIFFAQGGNSFGATARLGTNDAFALEFETNNTLAGTISSAQLWSIGPAAPVAGTRLYVQSTGTTSATFIADFYNSTPTAMVRFRSDGYISMGIANGSMTIGLSAGFNSTLAGNTFIGVSTGAAITTGTQNTALGTQALELNTTATSQVAIGFMALRNTTIGSSNTAIGHNAMASNVDGSDNTAVGRSALTTNVSGINNTAIGEFSMNSLTGNSNTAVGYGSMQSGTSASQNTSIGVTSLFTNSTGTFNVALGYAAGYYETGSDKLWIDNATRASLADGQVKALVYGQFAATTASQFITFNSNVGILTSTFGTGADAVFSIKNGTAPGSSPADQFQMYSADQAAGNAAPHFRTENGSIIKLYQQANIVNADGTLADITTKFNTLLGYLDNLGLTA